MRRPSGPYLDGRVRCPAQRKLKGYAIVRDSKGRPWVSAFGYAPKGRTAKSPKNLNVLPYSAFLSAGRSHDRNCGKRCSGFPPFRFNAAPSTGATRTGTPAGLSRFRSEPGCG
jgi:hypothetical protein